MGRQKCSGIKRSYLEKLSLLTISYPIISSMKGPIDVRIY